MEEVKIRFMGKDEKAAVEAFFAWFLDGGGESEFYESLVDRNIELLDVRWKGTESMEISVT